MRTKAFAAAEIHIIIRHFRLASGQIEHNIAEPLHYIIFTPRLLLAGFIIFSTGAARLSSEPRMRGFRAFIIYYCRECRQADDIAGFTRASPESPHFIHLIIISLSISSAWLHGKSFCRARHYDRDTCHHTIGARRCLQVIAQIDIDRVSFIQIASYDRRASLLVSARISLQKMLIGRHRRNMLFTSHCRSNDIQASALACSMTIIVFSDCVISRRFSLQLRQRALGLWSSQMEVGIFMPWEYIRLYCLILSLSVYDRVIIKFSPLPNVTWKSPTGSVFTIRLRAYSRRLPQQSPHYRDGSTCRRDDERFIYFLRWRRIVGRDSDIFSRHEFISFPSSPPLQYSSRALPPPWHAMPSHYHKSIFRATIYWSSSIIVSRHITGAEGINSPHCSSFCAYRIASIGIFRKFSTSLSFGHWTFLNVISRAFSSLGDYHRQFP